MLKKIFNELFSSDAPTPETYSASGSLSADAIHDLEARKRAIVADITRLAEELSACPDLGAPIGGIPHSAAAATPTFSLKSGHAAAAAEWLGRGEPWTGEVAVRHGDRARANVDGTIPTGGPYPRPATIAEVAEYFASRERGAK